MSKLRKSFKKLSKKFRYFFELIAVKFGIFLFLALGLKGASNFGSFLARKIGKTISVQKLARNNMKKALPHLNDAQIEQILDDMWDNLGRIAGEYIHICRMSQENLLKYISITKQTAKNIKNIKENYRGGIIFSAHTGNWEIGPKFFLSHGINVSTVYRPLNNKAVDEITSQVRNVNLIPKTTQGNKQIITEIKNGNYVIILVDQKISGGIEVPFFHQKAFTSSSIAKLALKYNIPLIPTRIIRHGKEFKFSIEISESIELPEKKTVDEKQVLDVMTKVNQKLESWICEYPSQWFWVHNRWKK